MNFDVARENMIQGQILPNMVYDQRVIEVMKELPREEFFLDSQKPLAYLDSNIDVGDGRYSMEPRILARLIQSAHIISTDIILSIGCALGYSVAVLARLGSTVFAVENNKALADHAARSFDKLGINNVVIIAGDPTTGYSEQAPYDVIFADGAITAIPDTIANQLAEGGRLVGVVKTGKTGKATLMTRHKGICSRRLLFDASVPVLDGFEDPNKFVF